MATATAAWFIARALWLATPRPSDKFGHGTHVAGFIGATGTSSGTANGYAATYAGMAPGVNLINLRVLDQNGSGTDSGVVAAIQEAITLQSTYNIRVISMSLGRPIFESYTLDPVDQAVEAAWKAGIVVVTAAGNEGAMLLRTALAPSSFRGTIPPVITVGATMTELTPTRADDQIASYSSKGPTAIDHTCKPDLVAPGNRQVSLRVAGSTLGYDLSAVRSCSKQRNREVLRVERYQHGHARGKRRGGADVAAEPVVDSQSSKSALDEDGVEGLRAVHLVTR